MTQRLLHEVGAGSPRMGSRENRFRNHPEIVLVSDAHSLAAEEFRKAAVRLEEVTRQPGTRGRALVVQSPLEGDGKTISAVNLALALAEELGRRALLVDMDLRRPSVDEHLVERERPGVAEYLRGESEVDDLLQFCPREHLHLLTAGTQAERCVTLLGPERLVGLLNGLRREFDWVVLDSPPLLPFAESRVLATLCDGVLLVARAERTPRAALMDAVGLVDPGRLVGLVFNDLAHGGWLRYGYEYAYRWREPRGQEDEG